MAARSNIRILPLLFGGWIFLVVLFFSIVLWDDVKKMEAYHTTRRETLEAYYRSLIVNIERLSLFVFEEHLDRNDVKVLVYNAWKGSPAVRDNNREILRQKLLPLYNNKLQKHFRQVHFHFPDSSSFLRMHKQDRYGDSLIGVRATVEEANRKKIPVLGFEEGRIFNGFRYVYPLSYRGEHIGTVEVSIPISEVENELQNLLGVELQLALKKSVVESRVFESEQMNYVSANSISPHYYFESPKISLPSLLFSQDFLEQINYKIYDSIQKKLQKEISFSQQVFLWGEKILVHFTPIANFTGENVGYLISYQRDSNLQSLTSRVLWRVAETLLWMAGGIAVFFLSSGRIKNVQSQLKHSLLVSGYLSDAVVFLDSRGSIIFVNAAFYRLTGYNSDIVIDNKIELLLSLTGSGTTSPLQMEKISSSAREDKKEGVLKLLYGQGSGTELPVEFQIKKIEEGREEAIYMLLLSDISARKEIDRLKEDIEHITRHDLKTPLNMIINLPEIIMEEDDLSPVSKDYLLRIQRAGESMLRSIDLSLKIVKMERSEYLPAKETIDFALLIRGAIAATEVGFRKTRRTISLSQSEESILLQGEELLLSVAIENLLRNALEADTNPEEIKVRLEKNSDFAVLHISNQTPIPEAMRDRIFEKYATYGKKNGTGLGTYSAKKIVELHGGTIKVKTSSDAGTQFSLHLPLS